MRKNLRNLENDQPKFRGVMKDDAEVFTDLNDNATWDDGEEFIDSDEDGIWDLCPPHDGVLDVSRYGCLLSSP